MNAFPIKPTVAGIPSSEINEIENLKSLKRDSTIYNNEENSNNFFKNPLIIAIIVIIFLAIFVYP